MVEGAGAEVIDAVVLENTNAGIDAVEEGVKVKPNAEEANEGVAWGAPAEGLNEAASTSNPAASLHVQELMLLGTGVSVLCN